MIWELLVQLAAAFGATVGFAVLVNAPPREFVWAGVTGAVGWGCYWLYLQWQPSVAVASLLASLMLALLSRVFSVVRRCPATVFLISGIFALVAGAGIYYTAYYFIMGDNAMAVSEVAKRAGIKGAESYVDARTLETDEDIAEAIEKYTVFGRVTPDQKRKFVRALKAGGHTVAMTGDGVNDVLALKEADCSIAMASGSDAASQVSHIVLLESNFAAMPSVVAEGRRVINNIERSAALFLVKNIFSFALALISLIFTLPYPVTSAQMSLVSALTIGAPGFVLAMEPNISRIKGKFLPNVIYRALPGALTDLFLVLGVILFCMVFEVEDNMMSTVCAIILNIVGLMVVHFTCKPYNLLRKVMIGGLTAAFVFCVVMLPQLFTLSSLDLPGAMILVVFALLSAPALIVIRRAQDKLKASIDSLHSPGRHAKKRAVKSREEE